jgi:uncharacterized protein YndB with AHSA1/START domain
MKSLFMGIAILGTLAAAPRAVPAADRMLRADLTVEAPVAEVWKAWTTDEGIATFFAPEGHVDLRVDGTYDVWFDPKGKPGERGAEGMRILGIEPMKRFAFTWNAPQTIPAIRGQRTMVILDFAEAGSRTTRLRFTELGWGDGPDWDRAYAYFEHAWSAVVLPRLLHRFAHGPIDWNAPPDLAPVAWSDSGSATTSRAVEQPATTALGGAQDVRYVVMFRPGPKWWKNTSFREQPGISEHVQHYRALRDKGWLDMGGPYLAPAEGGMMVPAAGMSEKDVRSYAANDPSVRSGVLRFEVVPWYVAMKR